MREFMTSPWPWYVAGPLIGLMVPLLLFLGNKTFGISSSMRHICAACFPRQISFFRYDWKKESWNLYFVLGIFLGGVLTGLFSEEITPAINPELTEELKTYHLKNFSGYFPGELFNWKNLFSIRGFVLMVLGGFMIGFGTRYAGGCTSGHAIMGLSNLQFPSLIATLAFMAGGYIMANFILPLILQL